VKGRVGDGGEEGWWWGGGGSHKGRFIHTGLLNSLLYR
jgi:hypothetical protein